MGLFYFRGESSEKYRSWNELANRLANDQATGSSSIIKYVWDRPLWCSAHALYDHVAITTLEATGRSRMNFKEWLVSAWTTNTINNLAGFGGVVGVSLRSSFYGKGMEKKKVLAVISKIAIFMLAGFPSWPSLRL